MYVCLFFGVFQTVPVAFADPPLLLVGWCLYGLGVGHQPMVSTYNSSGINNRQVVSGTYCEET